MGEIIDVVHSRPIDFDKVLSELSDVRHYLDRAADELGIKSSIMEHCNRLKVWTAPDYTNTPTVLAAKTGTVFDMFKKLIYYGKPLDDEAMFDGLCDIRFYLDRLTQEFNFTPKQVEDYNISKLSKRFKNGYTNKDAIEKSELKDNPFKTKEYNGLLCSVCGSPQFTTESGDVCENGHGGAEGIKPAPLIGENPFKLD